jgi:hypothetical protein
MADGLEPAASDTPLRRASQIGITTATVSGNTNTATR